MRRGARVLAVAVLVAIVVLDGLGASAQEPAGPSVTVDRASVRPGDSLVVTLTGWRSEVLTLSVCGNQAARGSSDCNMTASEGIRRNRDGSTTQRDFVVTAPATTCPCVVRASDATNDEVAVVPLDLIGHPTGPIVLPASAPRLQVAIDARRSPKGLVQALRAALGGPTPYEVTVSVRNPSTVALDGVVLAASAHRRGSGDVTALPLPAPGSLGPGQSWSRTVRSDVPAPVIGSFTWEVTASGAGPSVGATATARDVPVVLLLLLLLLAADLLAITWRRIERRRTGAAPAPAPAWG